MPSFSGPANHMRAKGNLDYLQFIRLVQRLWSEAHPEIPIIPTGDQKPAKYPCIIYGLEVRQAIRQEPKQKNRERIDDTVITGHRFDNMISFSAVAEHDPVLTEEIIEEFENWMLEMVPVFKSLGLSEMTYGRRLPDQEITRRGFGVVARAVVFHVRTEKVRKTSYKTLQSIAIDARTRYDVEDNHGGGNRFDQIIPRHYGTPPIFTISEEDAENNAISIPQSNFIVGDIVFIVVHSGDLKPGYYMIGNAKEGSGPPYAENRSYELMDLEENMVEITGEAKGRIFYVPDYDVSINIVDEHKTT